MLPRAAGVRPRRLHRRPRARRRTWTAPPMGSGASRPSTTTPSRSTCSGAPRPFVPQRRDHGLLRRRAQGVGREVGRQAVRPATRSVPARSSCQKWTPGREIVLTRNPDYWEEGKPYLDGVNYQLSFDPATALPEAASAVRWMCSATVSAVQDLPRVTRRSEVEGARLLPAAGRRQLPVHERGDEAVRRRQGATGAQLGDRPRQARRAPGWSGDEPLAVLSRGHAGPRGRQGLLRLRPVQGQATPG